MEKRISEYGPQSTDNLTEGSSNLYFTTNRVKNKADLVNGTVPNNQLPSSFTPIVIKGAVVAGSFASGELQGTQPSGSIASMRFCDGNYKYEFVNGKEDIDGSLFVWVRLVKV